MSEWHVFFIFIKFKNWLLNIKKYNVVMLKKCLAIFSLGFIFTTLISTRDKNMLENKILINPAKSCYFNCIKDKYQNFPKNFVVNYSLQIGQGENAVYAFGGNVVTNQGKPFNFVIVNNQGQIQYSMISTSGSLNNVNSFSLIHTSYLLVDTSDAIYFVSSDNPSVFQVDKIVNANSLSHGLSSLALEKMDLNNMLDGGFIYIDKSNQAYYTNYRFPNAKNDLPQWSLNINQLITTTNLVHADAANLLIAGRLIADNSQAHVLSQLYYVKCPSPDQEEDTLIDNKSIDGSINGLTPSFDNGLKAFVSTKDAIYLYDNTSSTHKISDTYTFKLKLDHPDVNFQSISYDEKNNILYAYSNSINANDAGFFLINPSDFTYQQFKAKELTTTENVEKIFIGNNKTINVQTVDANNFTNYYQNVQLTSSDTPSPSPSNDSSSKSLIIAITVGSVALFTVLAGLGYFYYRKKRKKLS